MREISESSKIIKKYDVSLDPKPEPKPHVSPHTRNFVFICGSRAQSERRGVTIVFMMNVWYIRVSCKRESVSEWVEHFVTHLRSSSFHSQPILTLSPIFGGVVCLASRETVEHILFHHYHLFWTTFNGLRRNIRTTGIVKMFHFFAVRAGMRCTRNTTQNSGPHNNSTQHTHTHSRMDTIFCQHIIRRDDSPRNGTPWVGKTLI